MKRTDVATEKKVIRLYKSGLSFRDVSQKTHLNVATTYAIIKRNNIETRTKGGIYRLNDQYIISSYKNGIRCMDLSKKYHVSDGTIRNYLKNNNINRDYIYINRSLRRDYFHNIDSYDKAYFLGFMITDGCVTEDNGIKLELQHSDYKILEVFREKTHNENKISYIHRQDGRKFADFHCKSKEMQSDLANYGVVFRKSLIVKFPILENEEMMSHFIRGIIDGNGWISFTPSTRNIGLCSASKDFIYSFHNYMIKTLNVSCTKIVERISFNKKYAPVYHTQWTSKQDILKIGEFIYKDKRDCYLERKWDKYCKIKSRFERLEKIYGNTEIIL